MRLRHVVDSYEKLAKTWNSRKLRVQTLRDLHNCIPGANDLYVDDPCRRCSLGYNSGYLSRS